MQSVLSTIPIYHMICFLLPKWVIQRIDKARRSFLWGGSNRRKRPISLCNWEMVTISRQWGGMGLADLHKRNISLLLRWWWKGYTQPTCLWTITITMVNWQGVYRQGPMLWAKRGSFFWTQLLSIKHLFDWSTHWLIGDGSSISYWYDRWGMEVLIQTGSRCLHHSRSLQKAVQLGIVPPDDLQQGNSDKLLWNWESSAEYSAKSVYKLLTGGGRIDWEFKSIWHFPIPPSTRIFLYLLLNDKLLTREVLMRRSFTVQDTSCPLCDQCGLETAQHLFFECRFACLLWNKIALLVGQTVMVRADSIQETWRNSYEGFKGSRRMRIKWEALVSAACWMLWRQRNCKVFEDKVQHPDVAVQWIMSQAALWERYCPRGRGKDLKGIG